jgi:hypothetical protein
MASSPEIFDRQGELGKLIVAGVPVRSHYKKS